ncbi:Aste57867_1949 [Aphanomyces stellatus]|uniref:Aste57867_1949 protein n=1 Tax=Aphanomyces stellatus TaxID=120398 RepID=A0A485KC04_9STRA|nr:hypothetical protein As57867_001947 [Aphanomyces stellatus]VFT79154.1 Aste57867_1949 [Aphanomyces stellatus]
MPISKWTESTDYVERFKELYTANPNAGVVTYAGVSLPPAVTSRIAKVGLTFQSLPNLLKQALLWDMGLVASGDADVLLQVLVAANTTMASIGLPWSTYLASSAAKGKAQTQCLLNGANYSRQFIMDGTTLPPILRCAVELVSTDAKSSILAQDALDATIVPEPRIFKHQDTTQGWSLPAIHTLPRMSATSSSSSGEAAWNACPADSNHQALVIPCEVKNARSESRNTQLPTYSAAMTTWLQEYKAANPSPDNSASSLSTGAVIGIVAGCLVIAALLLVLVCRKRRSTAKDDDEVPAGAYTANTANPLHNTGDSSSRYPTGGNYSADPSASSSSKYQRASLALDGINLAAISIYRLDEGDVVAERHIGAGASAEVLLASYKGRAVAVKRLLPGRASLRDIQAFVDEILLISSFASPYIVEFVGAVWDKPVDLACVLEYMNQGDLRDYLSHHTPAQFSWDAKFQVLRSIVEGLVYLHSFPIIHRDLKSRNVLLDATTGTKLTDFGVSKEQTQETMTVGVGTYRWMAPEILKYNHYTVAADVFSFGMILSELATHEIPYGDQTNPQSGKALVDTAIMAMVVSGSIQPTLPESMPPFLRDMALQCITPDPQQRPTALMLSHILRQFVKEKQHL